MVFCWSDVRDGPHPLRLVALTLAFLAATPGVGLGEGAAQAQDATALARQRFAAGVSALEEGRYALAEQSFLDSYRLRPHAATRCNLALTYERWGRPRDALRSYIECANEDATGDYRDHALESAERLRQETAQAPSTRFSGSGPRAAPAMTPIVPASATSAGGPAPYVVEPERSYAFLGLGLGSLALAAGGLTAGVLFALEAQDLDDQLRLRYGTTIPAEGEDQLRDALLKSDIALGLYIGSGVVGALGLLFLAVHLGQPAPPVTVVGSPDRLMLVGRGHF